MAFQTNPWWQEKRGWIFVFAFIFLFGLIELRLISMQVLNRPEFLQKAATNRIRAIIEEPVRGKIYDRNGKLMVENRPSYILYAQPWTIRQNKESIALLASVLDLPVEVVEKRISQRGWNTFSPAAVKKDVPFVQLARFEALRLSFPGADYRLEAKRNYLYPEAVHLLGYVSERSEEVTQWGQRRFGIVGKRGIELIYENWLDGEPGIEYYEVDASGRTTGLLQDSKPVSSKPGWNLYLNVDADLQQYACELMAGRDGAVVVLDPRDGAVLTMLSFPDYDPSLFSGVLPREKWEELQNDPGHPLLNRAIQGQYPPGSTFKMTVMAAALDEGLVNDNFKVTCGGGLQIGNRWFACWNHGGHGVVHPLEAIQKSCDVFFYTLGLNLGIEKMEEYSRKFGFGSKTGIDIDAELSGLVPGVTYMDKKYGKKGWTRGQLANIAIGQGDVLVTPLQLAVYTSAIATGKVVQPILAGRMVDPLTGEMHIVQTKTRELKLSTKARQELREGMRMAVNERGGTAYWLRNRDIVMAGKTGTAQNPQGEDHGLFVGFAPFDDPEIAVAVVVEHGEHGSTAAAPVACRLMERYLRTIHPDIPYTRYIAPVIEAEAEEDSVVTE